MEVYIALFRAFAYLRAALRSSTITVGSLPLIALGVLEHFEKVDWVQHLPAGYQGVALMAYGLVIALLRMRTVKPAA